MLEGGEDEQLLHGLGQHVTCTGWVSETAGNKCTERSFNSQEIESFGQPISREKDSMNGGHKPLHHLSSR